MSLCELRRLYERYANVKFIFSFIQKGHPLDGESTACSEAEHTLGMFLRVNSSLPASLLHTRYLLEYGIFEESPVNLENTPLHCCQFLDVSNADGTATSKRLGRRATSIKREEAALTGVVQ